MSALRNARKNVKIPYNDLKKGANMNFAYCTTETREAILAKGGPMLLGIFVECASHAENFQITQPFLAKRLNLNTKTLTKYIKMLRDLGLAQTVRIKGEGGQFIGSRWVFANHPQKGWLLPEQAEIFSITENTENQKHQKTVFDSNTMGKTNNNIKLEEANARQVAHSSNEPKASVEEKTSAFARFYEVFPRKQDRKRALSVFMRLTKGKTCNQVESFTETLTANVLQRCQYDAQWLRTINTTKSSIPYAKTYLSAERWADLYEPNLNGAPTKKDSDLEVFLAMGGTVEEYAAKK